MQSAGIEPLGVSFTAAEVRSFLASLRPFTIDTAYGRFRISNSLVADDAGGSYLLQVATSLESMDRALDRYVDLLLWRCCPACSLRSPASGGCRALCWRRCRAGRGHERHRHRHARSAAADERRRRSAGRGRRGVQPHAGAARARGERDAAVQLGARPRAPHASGGAARRHRAHAPARAGRERGAPAPRRPDRGDRRPDASDQPAAHAGARRVGRDSARAPGAVDLAALAASVVEQLEPVAQARQIDLTCSVGECRGGHAATAAGSSGCCSTSSTTR